MLYLASLGFAEDTGAAASGASAAGKATVSGHSAAVAGAGPMAPKVVIYRSWADIHAQKWTWDSRVRCTHVVNCWYQRNCCWEVYVKDGVVLREEQAGAYPAVNAELPDFNPRGCQKGASYSALIYAPGRLRYPLRRVGERGSGKWRRLSWDEALSEVADAMIDAAVKQGPDSVVLDQGGSLASATWRAAVERIVAMLDGLRLDTNTELDDGQAGAAVTLGSPVSSRSADDFFNSDLILIWGANPLYTQIPNAHFFNESRYHGARVVTIAPDYSSSAIHTDLYVPVRPGTDAALALSIAQVMLEAGRIDHDFIRAQTDLPLLLREDTGLLLRQSDLKKGGAKDRFYAYDTRRQRVVEAPYRDLDWNGVEPALSGRFEVRTIDGTVSVRPVLDVLKQRLDENYRPEQAAELCGTAASLIRRLAHWIMDARAVSGVAGSSLPKLYHGDLIMRAQLLVFILGGHIGRPGAGFDTCPFLFVDGTDSIGMTRGEGFMETLRHMPAYLARRIKGESTERILYDAARHYMDTANVVSSVLYWRRHAGLDKRSDLDWGRDLPRPVEDYVRESFRNKWQRKPPDNGPSVLMISGSNLLRRIRSADLLLKNAWPKIDMVVTTDIRMSTTCLHSDVLLPGAASYEKDDVTDWHTVLMPYLHITQAAVPPLGQAKPEWESHALLARKIQERAAARGIKGFTDRKGKFQSFGDFYRRYTFEQRFDENSQTEAASEVIEHTAFVEGGFDDFRKTGFQRINGVGMHPINLGNACDVVPDQAVINRGRRRSEPSLWPTLTRRIQFYIDHPLYMELGEELPVHKEPPRPGGDYPLVLSSGHTRWSIHAGWRNLDILLHLQRGEAAAFVSDVDARARGISDGDYVRLWNDVGEFRVRVKTAAAIRPGLLILYHAWEDYQFPGGRGYRNVLPSPLNPVEMAGGYNHLRPGPASLQPGQSDRETRVEMERA